MQQNNKPREHLAKAREHVAAMAAADDIRVLEVQWKLFLHEVERCWNKAISHYSRSPKWNGWQGPYLKAREQDPLLAYVRRARDADEHTVEEITEKQPGSLSVNAIDPSKPLRFSGTIGPNGVVPGKGPNANWKVDIEPARLALIPVVNRGKTYPVPTSHLGQPLTTDHPAALAHQVAEYYSTFLDRADAFFVK